jgi:hypothetical protein
MSDADIVATLKLRKAITVAGADGPKQIKQLTFKMPSGATVLKYGEPFTIKIEQDGPAGVVRIEQKIIPALASEYLAEMTGINAALLAQLHALDVIAAFSKLTELLRPTEG